MWSSWERLGTSRSARESARGALGELLGRSGGVLGCFGSPFGRILGEKIELGSGIDAFSRIELPSRREHRKCRKWARNQPLGIKTTSKEARREQKASWERLGSVSGRLGSSRTEFGGILEVPRAKSRMRLTWPAGEAGPLEVFDFESDRLLISVPHATLPGQAGGGGYLKASPLPPAPL